MISSLFLKLGLSLSSYIQDYLDTSLDYYYYYYLRYHSTFGALLHVTCIVQVVLGTFRILLANKK